VRGQRGYVNEKRLGNAALGLCVSDDIFSISGNIAIGKSLQDTLYNINNIRTMYLPIIKSHIIRKQYTLFIHERLEIKYLTRGTVSSDG